MQRTKLLASVAAVGALTVLSTAQADGGGETKYVGTLSFNYAYTDYDFTGGGFDSDTFAGSASFLKAWDSGWNLQPDFSFQSQRFDPGFGDFAVDTWRGGVNLFFRGKSGLLGLEAAYQSVDVGATADGYRIGARGELYTGPDFTLGLTAGYQAFDTPGGDLDGGYANGFATWYPSDPFGVSIKVEYAELDGAGLDLRDLGVGAEFEYLCEDSPLSLVGGVQYGDLEFGGIDADAWQLYLGLKIRFGSEGDSLADHHRSNTVEPTLTGLRHLVF